MRLQFESIQKSFGSKLVLDQINFTLESGRAFALLGRNGAGKTTSIRILMDVFPPDSGQISIDGRVFKPGEHQIGYLPEERGLYPRVPVLDQLIYFARLKGISKDRAKKSAYDLIERLAMQDYIKARLNTLSKGNQQKIQLAVSLISNPDILILDEPFSGLDPVNAGLLKKLILEEIAQGKIVMFSSHQMANVESICEEIVILEQGKIALAGDIREIKRSSERNRLRIELSKNQRILSSSEAQDEIRLLDLDFKYSFGKDNEIILERAESRQELLKEIMAANLQVEHFAVIEASLEDIFIQYTGGKNA